MKDLKSPTAIGTIYKKLLITYIYSHRRFSSIKKTVFFFIGTLFIYGLNSCSEEQTKVHVYKKHLGIYLDHGRREGLFYVDTLGNRYNYTSVTTTITNDSIIPIQLSIAFSNKYYTTFNGEKLKVFILPEEISGEKQYIEDNKDLTEFLNKELEKSTSFNKTIRPNEECNVTIGILTNISFAPDMFAIMSKELKPHFRGHDSLITEIISKTHELDLSIGLEYTNIGEYCNECFMVFPCGKMTFKK